MFVSDVSLVVDNFKGGSEMVRSCDRSLWVCISEGHYTRVHLFVLDFMYCCGHVVHGYELYHNFLSGADALMYNGCSFCLDGGGLKVRHDGDVVLSSGFFGSYTGTVYVCGVEGDFRVIFGDTLMFGQIPFFENAGNGNVLCIFEDGFEVPSVVARMILAYELGDAIYVGRSFFEACLNIFKDEYWSRVWVARFIENYEACEGYGYDCGAWLDPEIIAGLDSRAVDMLRDGGLLPDVCEGVVYGCGFCCTG